jgi:ketosteroid isomerase-like protein
LTKDVGEKAELIRQAFARWNVGDHDWVLQIVDPEVEIRVASATAFFGRDEPFRGHDGYREWIANMEEAFERWEVEAEEFRETADTVVVLGRMTVRGRASGVGLEQETGWVIEFSEGRVLRFQAFLSHGEALSASGLDEAREAGRGSPGPVQ